MTRLQDAAVYTTLDGTERLVGKHPAQTEDGGFTTRDVFNLPDLAVANTNTGYVFTTGDEKIITEFTATSSVLAAIPSDTLHNFPTGTVIRAVQIGPGRVGFSASPGVTMRWPKDSTGADCKLMRAVNSAALFRKRAANDWHVVGDLSAT